MTVYKPVEKLAKMAAEYAVSLANHEELAVDGTKLSIPFTVLVASPPIVSVKTYRSPPWIVPRGFR